MRLFADTNIVAPAVAALRAAGHDVRYGGELSADPGDAALLAEALAEHRVFLTKDHDIGTLVFSAGVQHAGVVLIDDLGSSTAETALLLSTLSAMAAPLSGGAFIRAGLSGARIANEP